MSNERKVMYMSMSHYEVDNNWQNYMVEQVVWEHKEEAITYAYDVLGSIATTLGKDTLIQMLYLAVYNTMEARLQGKDIASLWAYARKRYIGLCLDEYRTTASTPTIYYCRHCHHLGASGKRSVHQCRVCQSGKVCKLNGTQADPSYIPRDLSIVLDIRDYMSSVDVKVKSVLVLKLQDRPVREISDITGLSVQQIRTILAKHHSKLLALVVDLVAA